jgi:hypothetical protein
MNPRILFPTLFLSALLFVACAGPSLPLPLPGGGDTPAAGSDLTYDGALSITVKNGQNYPGTDVGYQGKSADGRALLVIGGEQAAKSTLDSVNFSGVLVPGTQLNLTTRVGTYDQNAVTLLGTVHIVIQDPHPQAGDPSPNQITAFSVPVQYTVNKNSYIPGSTAQFLGQSTQGAQFSNIGEFPYRSQFDSVVWTGHLRDKVAVRLDLRLLNSSDESATLAGTAQVKFEK